MTSDEVLIEPGFMFSQHSLGTFLRCARRFYLKYIARQPWPMPEEDDPQVYAQHLARGRVFHQWLARSQLGLDVQPLASSTPDQQLRRWWEAALRYDWNALPEALRLPEMPVVLPVGDYRLYARYDLVAVEPGGSAVIVDWKTLSVRLPDRTLHERIQTRVYLYTLVAAGGLITGGIPILPEAASMQYWFAEFPDEPCTVAYSSHAFERDRRYLVELVSRIAALPREGFACTEQFAHCVRCNYRGLCSREGATSTQPPNGWLDEDLDFALDIESAPELDY